MANSFALNSCVTLVAPTSLVGPFFIHIAADTDRAE
jgi:hypothetical protein